MTLQDARHAAKHQSKDGIVRHVVCVELHGTSRAVSVIDYVVATPEAMTDRYARLEQDDILFVYRDGKEY